MFSCTGNAICLSLLYENVIALPRGIVMISGIVTLIIMLVIILVFTIVLKLVRVGITLAIIIGIVALVLHFLKKKHS